MWVARILRHLRPCAWLPFWSGVSDGSCGVRQMRAWHEKQTVAQLRQANNLVRLIKPSWVMARNPNCYHNNKCDHIDANYFTFTGKVYLDLFLGHHYLENPSLWGRCATIFIRLGELKCTQIWTGKHFLTVKIVKQANRVVENSLIGEVNKLSIIDGNRANKRSADREV